MTTPRKLAANRQNALRSTGPRTERGKAIVSQNAVRHGLYSPTPVIPGVEDPAVWQQHRQATIANLAPLGQVEFDLAERVALILWRLRRLARYEHTVTGIGRDHAFAEINAYHSRPLLPDDTPKRARDRLTSARARLRALTRFADGAPDTPVATHHAAHVISALDEAVEDCDVLTLSVPDVIPGDICWLDVSDWTVEYLRRFVAAVANEASLTPQQLLATVLTDARAAVNAERAIVRAYTREVDTLRRERVLPQASHLDQLMRYEKHLSRQLAETLTHLRALQDARHAAPAPEIATRNHDSAGPNPNITPLPPSRTDEPGV